MWKSRYLTLRITAEVYYACVRSTLRYGCESWPVEVSDVDKLKAFKNRYVKFIAPKNQFVPSHAVSAVLKLEKSITEVLKTR